MLYLLICRLGSSLRINGNDEWTSSELLQKSSDIRKILRIELTLLICLARIILIIFGSDRSPRRHNLGSLNRKSLREAEDLEKELKRVTER